MKVEIDLQEGMHFTAVGQDGVEVRLDSAEEHGGRGRGFRPMELLLVSLGGCTAMDVISILRKMRQDVTAYRIEVEGEQASEHPHVFTRMSLRHIITGTVDRPAVERAIQLSEEKYCSAYAMLRQAAPISTTFTIERASG